MRVMTSISCRSRFQYGVSSDGGPEGFSLRRFLNPSSAMRRNSCSVVVPGGTG